MGSDPRSDAGDAREIFERLFAATYTDVVAYCRRRTPSISDADDAVAATYVVVWRRLDEAAGANSPLAWILGVAYRVLANQRRTTRRQRRLERKAEQLHLESPPARPERIVLDRADLEGVLAALASLPPLDREFVRLVAFEQLDYAQIAEAHGLSEGAVRSRLHRARARLRREASGTEETP